MTHHINEGYAVLVHSIQMFLQIPSCQDAAMHAWVQRLHPSWETQHHFLS